MQIFGGGGIGSRRLAPEEGSGSPVLGGKGALVTMGGNGDGEVFSPPISEVEEAFNQAGEDAPATLQLVAVSYQTKAGQAVSFTKPVLQVAAAAAA